MAGHMGHARVTTRNLRVLGVDKDENLLVVEGAVPGPNGGYVVISKSKRRRASAVDSPAPARLIR